MALVVRHLLYASAIVIDDVQIEGEFVLIFVHRREAGLALVQQHSLRTRLTRRRENNAAVREILRHDVVADLRGQVRRDDAPQLGRLECVLPEIPGRQIRFIEIRIERKAHCKQQRTAVIGNLDVADSGEALRQFTRDVDCFRTWGRAIPVKQVGTEVERDLLAQILLIEVAIDVDRNGGTNIGDRKIDDDRIGVLSVSDAYAVATATRSNARRRRQKRRLSHCLPGKSVPVVLR